MLYVMTTIASAVGGAAIPAVGVAALPAVGVAAPPGIGPEAVDTGLERAMDEATKASRLRNLSFKLLRAFHSRVFRGVVQSASTCYAVGVRGLEED